MYTRICSVELYILLHVEVHIRSIFSVNSCWNRFCSVLIYPPSLCHSPSIINITFYDYCCVMVSFVDRQLFLSTNILIKVYLWAAVRQKILCTENNWGKCGFFLSLLNIILCQRKFFNYNCFLWQRLPPLLAFAKDHVWDFSKKCNKTLKLWRRVNWKSSMVSILIHILLLKFWIDVSAQGIFTFQNLKNSENNYIITPS